MHLNRESSLAAQRLTEKADIIWYGGNRSEEGRKFANAPPPELFNNLPMGQRGHRPKMAERVCPKVKKKRVTDKRSSRLGLACHMLVV